MIRVRRLAPLGAALLLAASPAHAVDPPSDPGFEIDDDAAFKAAGFHLRDDGWHGCDDPGTASYVPGQIEQIADLNRDGAPEAVITEASASCYGEAGVGYYLVTSDAAGTWKLMDEGFGFATFLETRGKDNWPDLQLGGPGFCFPVYRWDGYIYELNRKEYEGKPCQ
jgi:hypothetical protein